MMIRIEEYIREDGASPYKAWFDRLDVQTAAKVTVATMRLGLGNTASLKSLAGGLAELRIDWGPGLRVYLAQDGETLVVLLGGGTKRSQQADIARARALCWPSTRRERRPLAPPRCRSRESRQLSRGGSEGEMKWH